MDEVKLSTLFLFELNTAVQQVLSGTRIEKTQLAYCGDILSEAVDEYLIAHCDCEPEQPEQVDELYALTLVEEERGLTQDERIRYVDLVQYCRVKDIEIPFGINY